MSIVEAGPYCPWIRLAGQQRRPQPWAFHQHLTFDWFIAMTTEGEEWLELDGQRHVIPPGDGWVLPPDTVFSRGSDTGNHAWYLHCHLCYREDRERSPEKHRALSLVDPGLRRWCQPGPELVFGHALPLRFPTALRPRLAGLLQSIIRTYQAEPEELQRCQGELTLFFAELSAHVRAQHGEQDVAARIARAEEIAKRSLAQDFDIRAFAAAAGWKPSRFYALYRELRGITPHQFLKRQRMARARQLLADPNLSIGSVASLVGHPNTTAFGRLFKQAHGCTPSEWREREGHAQGAKQQAP